MYYVMFLKVAKISAYVQQIKHSPSGRPVPFWSSGWTSGLVLAKSWASQLAGDACVNATESRILRHLTVEAVRADSLMPTASSWTPHGHLSNLRCTRTSSNSGTKGEELRRAAASACWQRY